jgi:hypothetical protein
VSNPVLYAEVAPDAVRYHTRRLAEATLALMRTRLKLRQPVTLRWFREVHGLREPGRVTFWSTRRIGACVHRDHPGAIWLRADLRDSDSIIEMVAHESRHLYQHEQHGDLFRDDDEHQAWQEVDAENFAAAMVARFAE